GRHRRRARGDAVSRLREAARRIPSRHHRAYLHARTEVVIHRHGLPVALVDVGGHEPGRDAWTGGERLPHFLRRAGGFELDRNRTSVSTARVARRLPDSLARRTRSPTSRTTRAPRAMR